MLDNHKEEHIKTSKRAWRHSADDLPFLHTRKFPLDIAGRRADTIILSDSLSWQLTGSIQNDFSLPKTYLNCWFRKFRIDRSWRRSYCIRRPHTSNEWEPPPALLLHFLLPYRYSRVRIDTVAAARCNNKQYTSTKLIPFLVRLFCVPTQGLAFPVFHLSGWVCSAVQNFYVMRSRQISDSAPRMYYGLQYIQIRYHTTNRRYLLNKYV